MAMTSINVRVPEEDKERFDALCSQIGLTMSTAVNLFLKASLRENKIPFELKADPFYGESNLQWLRAGIERFDDTAARKEEYRPLTAEELEALGLGKDGLAAMERSRRRTERLDAA